MWIEIAVVSAVLWTRWMSPGGAKPLTSPTWLSARELARPPHHGDDRERAVGLDVQGVAAVVVRRAGALPGGQHVRAGQVPAQLLGHELAVSDQSACASTAVRKRVAERP